MSNTAISTVVMFADVSGSSMLYKQVGNSEAKKQIAARLARIEDIVGLHQGAVVKTIGDEIMAQFGNPLDACKAGVAIQHDMMEAQSSLQIRIGASLGAAIHEAGDLFGEVVNDASAVAKIARGGQMIVTDNFFGGLPEQARSMLAAFDRVTLKGARTASVIYRVRWEDALVEGKSSETVFVDTDFGGDSQTRIRGMEISLQFGARRFDLEVQSLPFVIGRQTGTADMVIESSHVSRDHCHVLFRHGKFVLADHSTNGTWVVLEGEKPVYLRREELPLRGNGVISPGQPIDAPDAVQVSFFCPQ